MTDLDVVTLCFGSIKSVKELIAIKLREARELAKLTNAQLDVKCGFELESLPGSKIYENDPDRINGWIFSLVSVELNVKATDILPVNLADGSIKKQLLALMKDDKDLRVAATGSTGDGFTVSFDNFAPLYVIKKTLNLLR